MLAGIIWLFCPTAGMSAAGGGTGFLVAGSDPTVFGSTVLGSTGLGSSRFGSTTFGSTEGTGGLPGSLFSRAAFN